MSSGDTLSIEAGTYTPNGGAGYVIISGPSGSSGSPSIIQAYPNGANVIITGSSGGSGMRFKNTSYWNVSGLTITGTEEGLQTEGSNHITFTGMTVENTQIDCVHIHSCSVADGCGSETPSTYITFTQGTITGCGQDTSLNGDGFYIATDGDVSDTTGYLTLTYNSITNTGTECLNAKQYSHDITFTNNTCDHNDEQNNSYSDAAIMLKAPSGGASGTNDVIADNVISNPGPGAGGAYENSAIRLQRSATVYNNVIYGSNLSSLGYAFYTENSNTRLIYQNTVDSPTTRFINVASGSAPTVANNLGPDPTVYTNHNLAINSSYFVNYSGHNYNLVAGSAPIAAGTNLLSVVPTDIEGNPRTATPDDGAYQFMGDSPPSPPTGLTAVVH